MHDQTDSTVFVAERPAGQRWFVIGACLVLAAIVIALFPYKFHAPTWEDNDYFNLASGNPQQVRFFYLARIVHPLVVRAVSHLTGTDIPKAFWLVSCACLLGFVTLLGAELQQQRVRLFLIFAILANPLTLEAYRNYYSHDLFHCFLLMIFFLVFRKSPWLSLPLIYLLYLTRESTALLIVVVAVLAWLAGKRWLCGATLLTGFASWFTAARLIGRHAGNIHHLPMPVLYVLKVIYAIIYNIFGVLLWTNTTELTETPRWTYTFPGHFHLGAITTVGYCDFNLLRPVNTFVVLFASFGLLPIFGWIFRKQLFRDRNDLWIKVVLFYGLANFAVAPLLGTVIYRYILYAWPAFFLAIPIMCSSLPLSGRRWTELAVLVLVASWTPVALQGWYGEVGGLIASAGVEVLLICVLLKYFRGAAPDAVPAKQIISQL